MTSMISVTQLVKSYENGFTALSNINLDIKPAEIFALLGPNGAGKTTLISTICGIVNPTSGSVTVGGFDIIKDYKKTRGLIGLVPQELTTDAFESVWNTVVFTRGLFGKPPAPKFIEKILKDLSLWDKKDQQIKALSGGMKRRLMIAKALSHEPKVLFLDEPTAGVDVELRKDMWLVIEELRSTGVTIILTTHYIEEAEEIADRIGVINNGEIILVEDKSELMRKLGKKQLILDLKEAIPTDHKDFVSDEFEITHDGYKLIYTYENDEQTGIASLMQKLSASGIQFRDLNTQQSSLEDIFVSLVKESS